MSLNFLQKSLTRLANAQTSFKVNRSTEFVRHINKAVTDLNEVASDALKQTEEAYNEYLRTSNQPISNEIKDLQSYTQTLANKPLKLDISNSPSVNATLAEEISLDNEEAYRLIKRSKNPFINQKTKLLESNQLAEIKNRFKVYKKDKDVIDKLYSNAIAAQENPDPHPTLLEQRVHAQLMDGSFKNNVVWNPVINGEKQLGGYYVDNEKLIRLEDLKSTGKVDLEFEENLAKFVTDAQQLGANGNWNDNTRRELVSSMIKLVKSNPEAVRPVIFGGFTADQTEGSESSYATIFLDRLLADNGMSASVSEAQKDIMIDELKGKDLRTGLIPAFTDYFTNFIDKNAKIGIAVAGKKPNPQRKSGTDFSANAILEYNAFVDSFNMPDGAEINIPGTSQIATRLSNGRYQIHKSDGNPITLAATQKRRTISEENLLAMAKLPDPYKKLLKKTTGQKPRPKSNEAPLELTPEEIDKLLNTYYN